MRGAPNDARSGSQFDSEGNTNSNEIMATSLLHSLLLSDLYICYDRASTYLILLSAMYLAGDGRWLAANALERLASTYASRYTGPNDEDSQNHVLLSCSLDTSGIAC